MLSDSVALDTYGNLNVSENKICGSSISLAIFKLGNSHVFAVQI